MSANVHYALNTTDGTFVAGRRSVRLAAKKGMVIAQFTPRVERFTATTPVVATATRTEGYKATTPSERVASATATRTERYPALAPGTPAGVRVPRQASSAQRRTSPRLAPMYAKKAAAEKQKADAIRLVDEVLAYANKKAAAVQKEEPKGFTVFYDALNDAYVTCYCGHCEEAANLAELREVASRFSAAVKPLVVAGHDGSPQKTTAAMVATFDHPDLGIVLRGARVLPALARFREVLEKKAREFVNHPGATPTLRLVCAEILRKYFS